MESHNNFLGVAGMMNRINRDGSRVALLARGTSTGTGFCIGMIVLWSSLEGIRPVSQKNEPVEVEAIQVMFKLISQL